MSLTDYLVIALFIFISLVIFVPVILFIYWYVKDDRQKQHSILRNFPVIGKVRYITEKVGPELRQYLFNNDTEGKPFREKNTRMLSKPANTKKD